MSRSLTGTRLQVATLFFTALRCLFLRLDNPLTASVRRQSIAPMRFVAAFGIVRAHRQAPCMTKGCVAPALFIILTGFLSVRSLSRAARGGSGPGRAVRLVLPWLVWSALYPGGGEELRGPAADPLPHQDRLFSSRARSAIQLAMSGQNPSIVIRRRR